MQSMTKYLALSMSLLYLMLGAVLLGNSPFFAAVPRRYTLILGGLMIIYGLFRGYRTYQKYFGSHEN